jgi:hypothetical protein
MPVEVWFDAITDEVTGAKVQIGHWLAPFSIDDPRCEPSQHRPTTLCILRGSNHAAEECRAKPSHACASGSPALNSTDGFSRPFEGAVCPDTRAGDQGHHFVKHLCGVGAHPADVGHRVGFRHEADCELMIV